MTTGASGDGYFSYPGGELSLFATATNWKGYLKNQIQPFLGRRVVEVGAGCGGSTAIFCDGDYDEWILLEPDPLLAAEADDACRNGQLPQCCRVIVGTLANLPKDCRYDSVLYTDVLEHVEDDHGEFVAAASRLAYGGHLIVLSPAHAYLYSEFDRAIGHFRRYSRRGYQGLIAPGLQTVSIRYLDSVGMLASLANRFLLRQSLPSANQIRFWDQVLVRCSRHVDWISGYRMGKSILGIWQRVDQ